MADNNFLGLAHVGIFSDNFEETMRFYTEQLPFEIVWQTVEEPEDDMGGVFPMKMALLRLGGLYMEIMECANKGWTANGVAGALNHLGISVRNLDEAIATLKERGVGDDRFLGVTADDCLVPGKSFRQCRVKGYNGELIGLYEIDNETFFA